MSVIPGDDNKNSIHPDAQSVEDTAAYWAAALHNQRDWTSKRQNQLDQWLGNPWSIASSSCV